MYYTKNECVGECLDQLHSLHLVCVKLCEKQRSNRVFTSAIGGNPSPDLACVNSEDPDVFREQIRKLQFKWHVLMVRVVLVIEE